MSGEWGMRQKEKMNASGVEEGLPLSLQGKVVESLLQENEQLKVVVWRDVEELDLGLNLGSVEEIAERARRAKTLLRRARIRKRGRRRIND